MYSARFLKYGIEAESVTGIYKGRKETPMGCIYCVLTFLGGLNLEPVGGPCITDLRSGVTSSEVLTGTLDLHKQKQKPIHIRGFAQYLENCTKSVKNNI